MSARALSYADALAAVLSGVDPLPDEVVQTSDALGRALAVAVSSDIDLPPWDNAGMDGYALQRDDVRGATPEHPVSLRVAATIAAGSSIESLAVTAGTCMRIMTGAPVPAGADCVVRIEDTDRGTHRVNIYSDRDAAGRGNVRPCGEDVRAGELIFGPGTSLAATHIGVLASIGHATVRVHKQPRVAVVSSGDELLMLDEKDAIHSGRGIVASSLYSLPPLLAHAGAEVRAHALANDTLEGLTARMREALDGGCDLLVTTGGISVGEHDYTRAAVEALGGTVDFWRARIRPGGPLGFGHINSVPWIGLPGNPVSTMVTALLFAWPVVRRLGGHARVHHMPVQVRMRDRTIVAAPLTHFLRVIVERAEDGVLEAMLAGGQGSNLLRTLAVANALLVVPEELDSVEAGMMLDAILLPGHSLTSDVSYPGPSAL